MIFVGSGSVTLSECDINELHIGLKGTMDALYLKDLADKTRRGLRGRVENGKSGGPDASARLGLDLRQHLFVSGVQLGKDRARAGLFGFTTGSEVQLVSSRQGATSRGDIR
jgi:site-specific DNA recombinase